MALLDINSIIILVALFVIYGVFLLFDLFKRNEKYGYIAYIAAIIPVNYYWYLGFDVLSVYLLLFALWDIVLLRDTIGIYFKKNKDINEMILYLFLAIIIQIIVAAVLPEINTDLNTPMVEKVLWFYFPDLYTAPPAWGIESWVNSTILVGFRLVATLLVLLVIIPLILDIKDEEIPFPMFIIIVGIFIIPFLYLGYIWLPAAMGVLTFLFSVILFIILLLITRSGQETK